MTDRPDIPANLFGDADTHKVAVRLLDTNPGRLGLVLWSGGVLTVVGGFELGIDGAATLHQQLGAWLNTVVPETDPGPVMGAVLEAFHRDITRGSTEVYPPGTAAPPVSDDETGRAKDPDGTVTVWWRPTERWSHSEVTDNFGEEWSCDCGEEFPNREAAAAAAPACLGTDVFMTARLEPTAKEVEWPGEEVELDDAADLPGCLISAGARTLGEGYDDAFRDAAEPHADDLEHRLEMAWNGWMSDHDLTPVLDRLADIQTHDPRAPEGGG